MAIVYLMVGAVAGLLEGVFIKKYNEKHDKGGFIFTALVSLSSMLFFAVQELISGDGFFFDPVLLIYVAVAGLFYCGASFLTYVALGCGSFVMSMLILSYAILFPAVYGLIFLGEQVSVFTYIGLGVILVSLYLIRGTAEEDGSGTAKKGFSLKWLICILLSLIGSGMFSVVMKMQQVQFAEACDNEFMILSLGLSAAILLVVGILKDGKDLGYILRHGGLFAVGAGASNGATNMLSLLAYALIPVSIAAPISSGARIVISFLCSTLLFREKFLPRQIAGVILGAVAVILLNL